MGYVTWGQREVGELGSVDVRGTRDDEWIRRLPVIRPALSERL